MPRIGIGIVGTGFARHSYIPAFQSHGDARVVALCGKSEERTFQLAKEKNIPAAYTDYRALLSDPAVEAVYVAVPHDLHFEVVSSALANRLHVLCEKPLGRTAEQAAALYGQAEAARTTNQVAFLHRELPVNRELKRLVGGGGLGELRHALVCSYQGLAAKPTAPFTWRDQAARTGPAGALGDTGAHFVDLVQWLAGPIVRVCGVTHRFVSAHQDAPTGRVMLGDAPDAASFVAEFLGGAQCIMQVSFVATGCALDQTVMLSGSEGTLGTELHTEPPRGMRWHQLLATDRVGVGLRPADLKEDPSSGAASSMEGLRKDFQIAMQRVVDHFLRSIVDKPSGGVTFLDAVRCQEVIEAVVRSSVSGEWVTVRQWS